MEYTPINTVTIRVHDGGIARLECHASLPSTVALAKEYAKAGYPDRYIVFTDTLEVTDDTKKKKNTRKHGVFLSCILRPSIFTSQVGLLPHMAAVAFVTALEEHTSKNLGIGWISDIFCETDKIGGVTVEGKLDGEFNYEYIIVSFSAELSEESFPPRLADMVRKVFESENTSVSMIIAKNILNKFFPLFANLKNHVKFMEIYSKKFVQRSCSARYMESGKRKKCKILSVDLENGALIVEGADKKIIKLNSQKNIIISNKLKLQKK